MLESRGRSPSTDVTAEKKEDGTSVVELSENEAEKSEEDKEDDEVEVVGVTLSAQGKIRYVRATLGLRYGALPPGFQKARVVIPQDAVTQDKPVGEKEDAEEKPRDGEKKMWENLGRTVAYVDVPTHTERTRRRKNEWTTGKVKKQEKLYQVQNVEDYKIDWKGREQFLIHWKDYDDPNDFTWEFDNIQHIADVLEQGRRQKFLNNLRKSKERELHEIRRRLLRFKKVDHSWGLRKLWRMGETEFLKSLEKDRRPSINTTNEHKDDDGTTKTHNQHRTKIPRLKGTGQYAFSFSPASSSPRNSFAPTSFSTSASVKQKDPSPPLSRSTYKRSGAANLLPAAACVFPFLSCRVPARLPPILPSSFSSSSFFPLKPSKGDFSPTLLTLDTSPALPSTSYIVEPYCYLDFNLGCAIHLPPTKDGDSVFSSRLPQGCESTAPSSSAPSATADTLPLSSRHVTSKDMPWIALPAMAAHSEAEDYI